MAEASKQRLGERPKWSALEHEQDAMEMIMSMISSAPAAAQAPAGQSLASVLAAALKRWWVAYMTWRIQQAAIATLSALSDRQLKDIGLSRSEIIGAVRETTRDRAFLRCS
jgi:uncharacterized protein YjiS (DUF1127 family)